MTTFRANTLEIIEASLEAGVIYNTEFQTVKSDVNRTLERMWSERVDQVYLGVDYDSRDAEFGEARALYGMDCCPSIHTFENRVRKVAKIAAKCDHALVADAAALLEEVRPVVEKMVALKEMIVKGRRPSANPRKTPERTLDNTGTCAICGKNVKLKDGKIVAHGYTVRYGFFQGGCFGIGYAPIETSAEGAEAYLAALIGHKDRIIANNTDDAIAATVERMSDKERRGRSDETMTRIVRASNDSTIRMLTSDIETFGRIINTWEAKPLPGTKA